MWILQYLPAWIFLVTLLLSIIAYIFTKTVKLLSYFKLIEYGSILVMVFSIYMTGTIQNNDRWLAKTTELEFKVKVLAAQSNEVNTTLKEKVIVKTQIVKTRGEDIVKYVDREVTKYDASCVIPKEFVEAHNQAAEQPK